MRFYAVTKLKKMEKDVKSRSAKKYTLYFSLYITFGLTFSARFGIIIMCRCAEAQKTTKYVWRTQGGRKIRK